MTVEDFALSILNHLTYEPNSQQVQVVAALARFCMNPASVPGVGMGAMARVFILNGYAGTGKTSLTGALVKALADIKVETVLLAPTGRAAKVFGTYAGVAASTIHRRIYKHVLLGSDAGATPKENKSRNAIFIVDEASMIAAEDNNGSGLLADLIYYVYSGEGCRLILLGDTAQLPPVGSSVSPAVEPDVLRSFGLKVTRATLTEVARQDSLSGILLNATRIRRELTKPSGKLIPLVTRPDVSVVMNDELPDLLDNLYRRDGIGETIVITRSNMSATQFNYGIRAQVLERDEILCKGDLLIAVKNNYHWTRKTKGLGFIANGEIMRLISVDSSESRYGQRFADVTLAVADRPDVTFQAKVILSCLTGNSAALDGADYSAIYNGVYNDPDLHAPGASHMSRIATMRNSAYIQALQVKYAYAVTCHKAQGGQWANVVVDLSYIPPEQVSGDFYRWLYTAITRASSHLYLINPPEELIES